MEHVVFKYLLHLCKYIFKYISNDFHTQES